MCKTKKKKGRKIWVKYKLYHISNLKDLGLANECLGFTTRGGATEVAEREKYVSYTTFIVTEGKEWKRRAEERTSPHHWIQELEGTHHHKQMGHQTWERQEGKTKSLMGALGFQSFPHPTVPTMDKCGLDSCKYPHTQWLEQAHNRHRHRREDPEYSEYRSINRVKIGK